MAEPRKRSVRWGLLTLLFLAIALASILTSNAQGRYTALTLAGLIVGFGGAGYCTWQGPQGLQLAAPLSGRRGGQQPSRRLRKPIHRYDRPAQSRISRRSGPDPLLSSRNTSTSTWWKSSRVPSWSGSRVNV